MRHIWDDILQMASARAARDLGRDADAYMNLRDYFDGFLQYWLDNPGHWRVVSSIGDALFEAPAGPGVDASILRPMPCQVLKTLCDLLDGCTAPARDTRYWQELVEMLFCKALGFLHAVIGVVSYPWPDVPALKRRVVDDMVDQVRAAALAATPRPRVKAPAPQVGGR